MKRFFFGLIKGIGIFLVVLLLLMIIVPLVIPIPPLDNVKPIAALADPDSKFIQVNGINVHYKEAGQGEPVIILLHGFGASTWSWREVMAPLSKLGRVIAYDRPAFGLTDRPMTWEGQNPYSSDAQPDLLIGLMDKLGVQNAILVGNSAGGTVAAQAALQFPTRVRSLVLVDAAIYENSGGSGLLHLLFQSPQAQRIGPWLVRNIQSWGMDFLNSAWHDPSKITDAIKAGYRKPLQAPDWDRALWLLTASNNGNTISQHLSELKTPVLVVTGDDDRIVATANSVRLSKEIPGANLVVFPACGHTPQEECPTDWLNAVEPFIQTQK